jgi:hypothetical protein
MKHHRFKQDKAVGEQLIKEARLERDGFRLNRLRIPKSDRF